MEKKIPSQPDCNWDHVDAAIKSMDLLALLKLDIPPKLTPEQKDKLREQMIPPGKKEVSEEAKSADVLARQEMAVSLIGLAISRAREARERTRSNVSLIDILGDGLEGLIVAMRRFDPDMGYKFSTYATWWVKKGVRRAVTATPMGEISDHTITNLGRLQAAERELENADLRVTTERLAERMGESPPWVKELQEINQRRAHLPFDPATEMMQAMQLGRSGSISRPVEDEVEDEESADMDTRALRKAIGQLPGELKQVIELRFGLNGQEPMTQQKVSQKLKISSGTAWNREKQAEAMIKHLLEE